MTANNHKSCLVKIYMKCNLAINLQVKRQQNTTGVEYILVVVVAMCTYESYAISC